MKLRRDQIDRICHKVAERLRKGGFAAFKAAEKKIVEEASSILFHNMQEEDKIEELAREMVDKYRSKIESGEIDGRKFFLMIKQQLAKDRNFVI